MPQASPVQPYDGTWPRLGTEIFIADTARVIGQVQLGDQVSVWYGAVLRGDVGEIRIGARSNVQDNATLHMTFERSAAWLGEEVIVAHNAVIHGAIIEDRALVGMGAVVMDNARVEEGAWVAAGSVVPPGKCVPRGRLFVGGEVKRAIRPEEQEWAAGAVERYLELSRKYRDQSGPPQSAS